jgi:drug/metabolite transporter (DMT)-like permease
MKPERSNNLFGIMLMVGGMVGLSLGDLFLKLSARSLPVGEVMLVMGLGSAAIYLALVLVSDKQVWHPVLTSRLFWLRIGGEMVSGLGLFLALALTPLSLVAAILQMLPLVITLGAALFLAERVGPHRIGSVLVGFAGVMLIIRPGSADFDIGSLFAVLAVLGMALRDIVTRKIARLGGPQPVSSRQLSFYSSLGLSVTGAGMLAFSGGAAIPQFSASLSLAAMVVCASIGYFMVTHATRIAELSVVSPYRYSRLLFSLLIGGLVLQEVIDLAMLAGSALVIVAGIYIWFRETRTSRQRTSAV